MTSPNERPIVTLDVRVGNVPPTDLRSMPFGNLSNLSDELLLQVEQELLESMRLLSAARAACTPYSAAVSDLARVARSLDGHVAELEKVAQELIRRRAEGIRGGAR